jgi:cell division septum initiation protein DivIVA
VLSQENDAGARRAAGDDRGDSSGQVEVPGQGSPSAARLLEMTARDTDQWRSDARAEAAQTVAAAQEEAEALVRSARQEAAGLVEAARLEAARTLDEARATALGVQAESEQLRTRAEAEVSRLQQVAADHSQHLRRHLNDVLGRLDAAPTEVQPDRDDDDSRSW